MVEIPIPKLELLISAAVHDSFHKLVVEPYTATVSEVGQLVPVTAKLSPVDEPAFKS